MNFKKYLKTNNISLSQAQKELGYNYEDVRRYCNCGTIPRPERMEEIKIWSSGAVQPNDFYNLKDGESLENKD